jgi:hypothetical protein
VAKRLRPDVAVLAIMEPSSQRSTKRLEELKRGLSGSGIDCELITVRSDDLEDKPYL